eukprot:TRINITY_DN119797_c0_g1_i1.p1 TRINITY_DN119797_c0_g1~~TRINITY_DN119797_c0_g1_i1.p1  ORF type:complete len:123 (+),score=16.67 TRINITY_DN119797_c0_g1_i1:91-459(+)
MAAATSCHGLAKDSQPHSPTVRPSDVLRAELYRAFVTLAEGDSEAWPQTVVVQALAIPRDAALHLLDCVAPPQPTYQSSRDGGIAALARRRWWEVRARISLKDEPKVTWLELRSELEALETF